MKATTVLSHFGGLECVMLHHSDLWSEIQSAIARNAHSEDPHNSYPLVRNGLVESGWSLMDDNYLIKGRLGVSLPIAHDSDARLPIERTHLALFGRDIIDVGVAIVPTKEVGTAGESLDHEQIRKETLLLDRSIPPLPLIVIGIAYA